MWVSVLNWTGSAFRPVRKARFGAVLHKVNGLVNTGWLRRLAGKLGMLLIPVISVTQVGAVRLTSPSVMQLNHRHAMIRQSNLLPGCRGTLVPEHAPPRCRRVVSVSAHANTSQIHRRAALLTGLVGILTSWPRATRAAETVQVRSAV